MAHNLAKNILRQNHFSILWCPSVKNFTTFKHIIQGAISCDHAVSKLTSNQNRIYIKNRFYATNTAQKTDEEYITDNKITILGEDIPSPFRDIDSCGFPEYIKTVLKEQGITTPTVIQSQGWPIALAGKNFVGIAQTGTGKTLAYLLPAVVHIKETEGRRGRGPRVLIVAPTRELARQIEEVAKEFQKSLGIRSLCIYGGVSRSRQAEELKYGVDILIATPGRLNDFIDSKVTNLSRCNYVVLDEADRMLDMGFEPQIRKALEGVPYERQILMFSATWPKEVQYLAKDYLGKFVQVNVGSTDLTANHNIKQNFYVLEQGQKMDKLKQIMHDIAGHGFGKILVFTNTKRFVDNLTLSLRRNKWPAVGIHGDKSQAQRDVIINKFRSGTTNILVATDVAARGLDVDGITHVINYDFPNTTEDYIHRIGRTGRSQNKGVSYTFLTTEEGRHAHSIIAVLKEAKQEVPEELEFLARDFSNMKNVNTHMKQRPKPRNYNFRNNRNNRWNNYDRNNYY
ncbi:unnamed protein product [Pieris macdunnoughi]|uniref:RNA helicase n=1 Tax=Pieris macdunnoughi TaxID=345717 RepID=A0A821VMA5_9NEOP|nr:unnamed protein product [Pieris macdunnoughi]